MFQILNDDFNVFSFSDFCHQFLIFVSTVDADHISMFTAISEFYHFQFLEFMIISISTIFYE